MPIDRAVKTLTRRKGRRRLGTLVGLLGRSVLTAIAEQERARDHCAIWFESAGFEAAHGEAGVSEVRAGGSFRLRLEC